MAEEPNALTAPSSSAPPPTAGPSVPPAAAPTSEAGPPPSSDPQPPPASQPGAAADGTPPPPPTPEQMVPRSRVDQITREKWEARRRAEELEREVATLRGQSQQAPVPPAAPQWTSEGDGLPQPQPPPSAADPAAFERIVQARAAQIAQQQTFTDRCNATYAEGTKDPATPDFAQALRGFDMFGGLQRFPDLVEAAISVPDGHRLLHHLGTHLDEAERVLSMSPAARTMELGRLSARMAAAPTPKPSGAPPPPVPIRGVSAGGEPGPDDQGRFSDQAAYRAWRAKQQRGRV